MLWHLLSVAVVDVPDVLSLIAELHQCLHHLLVVLGVVLAAGLVLALLALCCHFGLVFGARYSRPWLLQVACLLLLGCAGECLVPAMFG